MVDTDKLLKKGGGKTKSPPPVSPRRGLGIGVIGAMLDEGGDRLGTKSGTTQRQNRGQAEDNLETKLWTLTPPVGDRSETDRGRTGDKTGDSLGTKNRGGPGGFDIRTLARTRRKVVKYLFAEARRAGGTETPIVQVEDACEALEISAANWKKTTQRLVAEGVFTKTGLSSRGTIYSFDREIFLLLAERDIEDRAGTKPGTESGTNAHCSSGELNKAEALTTTEEEALAAQAKEIHIYGSLREGGVGHQHIIQCLRGGIEPEAIQLSLAHLAFQIAKKDRGGVKSPVRVFMAAMRTDGFVSDPGGYAAWVAARRRDFDDGLKMAEGENLKQLFDENVFKLERQALADFTE